MINILGRRGSAAAIVLCLGVTGLAQAETHTIFARVQGGSFIFDPSQLTIEAGDTVTWRNAGGMHNVVGQEQGSNNQLFRCSQGCDGEGGNGAPSTANWQFSRTFDEPGGINYYCEPHQAFGMTGTITIVEGTAEVFPVNFGHTGSWYNPATDGQGFLGEVLVDENDEPVTMVTYWFTWDNSLPAVKFAGEEQRWFVAAGPIEDGVANMTLTSTTGGLFDDPQSTETVVIGTLTFTANNCTQGQFAYDINQNVAQADMSSGIIDVQRLTPDVLCESLAASQ